MTLPESLVDSIKMLVKAHETFQSEVEELQALSKAMQVHINRLVARQAKLADIDPTSKEPVSLPRAILPNDVKNDV